MFWSKPSDMHARKTPVDAYNTMQTGHGLAGDSALISIVCVGGGQVVTWSAKGA